MFTRKSRTVIGHPLAHQLYNYVLGRRFDPGAMAEALLPRFSIPVTSFVGSARVAGTMSKFQPPQVYFLQQRGLNGVGGIQSGQIISQPLLDPVQLTDENGG